MGSTPANTEPYGDAIDVAMPQLAENWPLGRRCVAAARTVRHDLRDLRPRDMIDIQSFLWVQGRRLKVR